MLMNGWMKMFKSDFPIFQNHPELVFLDSAASAQKPKCALDAMVDFYTHSYSGSPVYFSEFIKIITQILQFPVQCGQIILELVYEFSFLHSRF